jgi:acetoin utilization protein AcuB
MSNQISDIMNGPISGIMTKKLWTVIPTDSLTVVRDLFTQHNIHHIPVVRHKELLGVISRTDYYRLLHGPRLEDQNLASEINEEILNKFTAADLMTKHVATLQSDDKIGSAAELFLENVFHAVPVMNSDNELEGMITSYDIIKTFFHEAYPNQDLNHIK